MSRSPQTPPPLPWELPARSGGLPGHHQLKPLERGWTSIESFLGIFGAMIVSTLMFGLALLVFIKDSHRDPVSILLQLAFLLVAGTLEVFLILNVKRFYDRRRQPFVLMYGLHVRGPRIAFFSFPLTVWWTAHAAVALTGALWLEGALTDGLPEMSLGSLVFAYLALMALALGAAHASLLHLFVAARCAGLPKAFIRSAWRFRIGIDIAIVLLAIYTADPKQAFVNTWLGETLHEIGMPDLGGPTKGHYEYDSMPNRRHR